MQLGKNGEDSEQQITKEMGAKGLFWSRTGTFGICLPPRTESDSMPATLLSRRAGYNVDHRMKCLKGAHL